MGSQDNILEQEHNEFINSELFCQMIKEKIAPLIKGGGGGQKTLATAGGQDASQLNKVIEVVKQSL